jgi:hypothetical protein
LVTGVFLIVGGIISVIGITNRKTEPADVSVAS